MKITIPIKITIEFPDSISFSQEKHQEKSTFEQETENSLGMRFLNINTGEKNIRFSRYLTRIGDYIEFLKDIKRGRDKPSFVQEPDHPAVNVSWDDAVAFCRWLTERERKFGLLEMDEEYRLPTDVEWSVAVGLPAETGRTPAERNGKNTTHFPWGTQWPPPRGAGNYAQSLKVDDYEYTSPVGSFAANTQGLYDMGGNVWEWCEDWYDDRKQYRVLRGASWFSYYRVYLLSSYRSYIYPGARGNLNGFRVVMGGCAPKAGSIS